MVGPVKRWLARTNDADRDFIFHSCIATAALGVSVICSLFTDRLSTWWFLALLPVPLGICWSFISIYFYQQDKANLRKYQEQNEVEEFNQWYLDHEKDGLNG